MLNVFKNISSDVETWSVYRILQEPSFDVKIMQKMWNGNQFQAFIYFLIIPCIWDLNINDFAGILFFVRFLLQNLDKHTY